MDIVKYVSFEQAFESIPVGKRKLQANAYLVSGQFPVVDQGQSQISGYTNYENLVIKNCLPFIVFGDHTRAVKYVDFPFVVGADGVRLFQAKEGFESEFLYFFLKNALIPNDGYGRHSKHLENLKVPLCLPKLQSTIVARLKSQLTTLEQARTAAQLQLTEITNLANAIIRQSVEHPDTAPAKLGDVLNEVKKGVGKTWAEYPVLGATRAGLALAKEPVGKVPERYKPVLHGTVFYNPMRIMIGSIAMVDEFDTPGITSPDYVALRGKEGLVDSRWFYYWLRSPYGVSCIASLARGAVRERMLFNRLAEGSIELPSYAVQVTAAKALAELKPMRRAIEKQLAEINLLPGKILAKAFEIA
jgi:type I restriction enzyme S subunit